MGTGLHTRGHATMIFPTGKPVTVTKKERARDLSIRPTSWCCIFVESNPNAWPWNKEETVLQFNYGGWGYSCLLGCNYFFIGTLITSQPKVARKVPGSNSTWSSCLSITRNIGTGRWVEGVLHIHLREVAKSSSFTKVTKARQLIHVSGTWWWTLGTSWLCPRLPKFCIYITQQVQQLH